MFSFWSFNNSILRIKTLKVSAKKTEKKIICVFIFFVLLVNFLQSCCRVCLFYYDCRLCLSCSLLFIPFITSRRRNDTNLNDKQFVFLGLWSETLCDSCFIISTSERGTFEHAHNFWIQKSLIISLHQRL